ncbi:MAG: single-stranded-DNA-specific exonuclease RecJ [Candidatus Aminicenantes bacterium]|nr:single-stranded-DNA-specific exonuclease RecJ [Candidatus Aminicenantes bacterium]
MRDTLWIRPDDDGTGARLAAEMGVSEAIGRLLVRRGISDIDAARRFLHGTLDELIDPFLMNGMREAVGRIRRAVDLKEKILVFGDYDVDGVLSVVMLLKALRALGADADFFIPDRLREGYGIKREHAAVVAERGVGLVISVDCGIKAVDFTERVREMGADVIITDHHLPGEVLPRALAVLNPVLEDSGYPEKGLAGVGVAYKLIQALLDGGARGPEWVQNYLKPVAIGTIADVAPLKGENRILVRYGLDGLGEVSNVGLRKLLEACGLSRRRISEGDIGFRIGPRINAAGRMGDAAMAVRLFFAPEAEAAEIVARLEKLNAKRQSEEDKIFKDAVRRVGERGLESRYKFFALGSPDWHRGIVGIVASKLKDHYHRPVLLFSYEDGKAHGSGRSISGFPIIDCLEACRGHVLSYGGHPMAVGCVLETARLPEFKAALNAFAAARLSDEDLRPRIRIDDRLGLAEIDDAFLAQYRLLGPFGAGNPRPVFLSEAVEVSGPPQILKNKHLKFTARQDGAARKALAWGRSDWAPRLRPRGRVDLVYSLQFSEFLGEEETSLNVEDLKER